MAGLTNPTIVSPAAAFSFQAHSAVTLGIIGIGGSSGPDHESTASLLGRMAIDTGRRVTWEELLKSE